MPYTTIKTTDIRPIAQAIGYRKRTAKIRAAESVTLSRLNWDGGSRSEYTAFDLATGRTSSPDLGRPHPADNRAEGQKAVIPPGVVILEHGTFMGKPATLYIHANPADMPRLLTA